MSYKTYRLYKAVLVVIIAALVGWAVPAGNAFVPVPAAIIGMLILLFIRRGVKEIIVDERTYNIANQASRAAFQIVTLAMVLIGATLVALGNSRYPEAGPAGFTLIYSACGFLVVYLIGYIYYNRKLGGGK
jgi:uncharacterized membrane protein